MHVCMCVCVCVCAYVVRERAREPEYACISANARLGACVWVPEWLCVREKERLNECKNEENINMRLTTELDN